MGKKVEKTERNKLTEDQKKIREKERDFFEKNCGAITDPVLLILASHLYMEYMLERMISVFLPRGDKIIEKGNLSFAQKITIIDSFDLMDDKYITMIRHLNTVRNKCSHVINYQIDISDIELIGRPLGRRFTEIRKEKDNLIILKTVIYNLAGYVGGTTYKIENH